MKDLSLAVEALWEDEGTQERFKYSENYVFDPSLMEYADSPEVHGYMDFKQYKKSGETAKLRLPKAVPEYLDGSGKRLYRSDLTIPPKVRQMLFEASGAKDWNSFNLAAALITFACLGVKALEKSQWDVEAAVPKDPDLERRTAREEFIREMRTKRRRKMRMKG